MFNKAELHEDKPLYSTFSMRRIIVRLVNPLFDQTAESDMTKQLRRGLAVAGVALVSLLYVAALAPAEVTGLTNGDFENTTEPYEQDVNSFFESSNIDWAEFTVEGTNGNRLSTANAFNSTQVLGLGVDGYLYQQIGTYTADEIVTLTGSAYRTLSHENALDFTVKLYAGDVTGATGSTLSTLGATELDGVTITSAGLGFTGTSLDSSLEAALDVDLLSGNSGTDGQALWLEIAYSAGEGGETYFDNLAVSGAVIPEPSTFALLGMGVIGMLLLVRRRTR
ncbi:unnamed protein product [marine sediment metagenome]|uniref:Ice-binding protein C-terminal domain-containing protein n=1 Tax=marine sediment metagenome TaxID=412755 RepID=X0TIC2_9ZZZZ